MIETVIVLWVLILVGVFVWHWLKSRKINKDIEETILAAKEKKRKEFLESTNKEVKQ